MYLVTDEAEADSVLNKSITSKVLIDLKLFNRGFSAYKWCNEKCCASFDHTKREHKQIQEQWPKD